LSNVGVLTQFYIEEKRCTLTLRASLVVFKFLVINAIKAKFLLVI
jgi:hypothetical protein